ncbi:hypothetical protein BASA50_004442 [Batrachochytrium salamandrivorans]|uniref:Uncharacterized protein n=1 Tax=Batrachochytrium salamandrivorans TaxID=1357716 RepID=A0ABQ8FFS9_9FUNG|nr:hypothetical protein BASA60_002523 [Batrachochytrium salamandrivorans]KAH6597525.1 hypothetical protein BASA50_004442 [Batrachochytrium salamandrivorans]KAH9265690.1 hypothetical protein BASA83_010978 [Batrachochytrium salamandrivorans]
MGAETPLIFPRSQTATKYVPSPEKHSSLPRPFSFSQSRNTNDSLEELKVDTMPSHAADQSGKYRASFKSIQPRYKDQTRKYGRGNKPDNNADKQRPSRNDSQNGKQTKDPILSMPLQFPYRPPTTHIQMLPCQSLISITCAKRGQQESTAQSVAIGTMAQTGHRPFNKLCASSSVELLAVTLSAEQASKKDGSKTTSMHPKCALAITHNKPSKTANTHDVNCTDSPSGTVYRTMAHTSRCRRTTYGTSNRIPFLKSAFHASGSRFGHLPHMTNCSGHTERGGQLALSRSLGDPACSDSVLGLSNAYEARTGNTQNDHGVGFPGQNCRSMEPCRTSSDTGMETPKHFGDILGIDCGSWKRHGCVPRIPDFGNEIAPGLTYPASTRYSANTEWGHSTRWVVQAPPDSHFFLSEKDRLNCTRPVTEIRSTKFMGRRHGNNNSCDNGVASVFKTNSH